MDDVMVDIKNRPPYNPVSCSFDLFSDAMTCWRMHRNGLRALNCMDCVQCDQKHCIGARQREKYLKKNKAIINKFYKLCDEEEEVIDAVGVTERVTRDASPCSV